MMVSQNSEQFIFISLHDQQLQCFYQNLLCKTYSISTAKNGPGEQKNSECTPRGWHRIYSRLGLDAPINSVFVARQWTGELYTPELATSCPNRDWILTRILQLEGLELGRNRGGEVDSLERFIYIHGTPDSTDLTKRGSRGCIRMQNSDLIELTDWVKVGTVLCIE